MDRGAQPPRRGRNSRDSRPRGLSYTLRRAAVAAIDVVSHRGKVILAGLVGLALVAVLMHQLAGREDGEQPEAATRETAAVQLVMPLVTYAHEASQSAYGTFASVHQAVAAIEATGAQVGYYVCTLSNELITSYNADTSFYAASAIKGPWVISVVTDPNEGTGQLRSTLADAIVWSDNKSYYNAKLQLGADTLNSWLAQAGAPAVGVTSGSYIDLTPKQLAEVWIQAYDAFASFDDKNTKEWLDTTFDEPLNSQIAQLEADDTLSKPGWTASADLNSTVNAGVIVRGDTAYVMAVMSSEPANFKLLDPLIVALDRLEQEVG